MASFVGRLAIPSVISTIMLKVPPRALFCSSIRDLANRADIGVMVVVAGLPAL